MRNGHGLPARAVQPLALALHKMMTNAVKHGALGKFAQVCWSGSTASSARLTSWLHLSAKGWDG